MSSSTRTNGCNSHRRVRKRLALKQEFLSRTWKAGSKQSALPTRGARGSSSASNISAVSMACSMHPAPTCGGRGCARIPSKRSSTPIVNASIATSSGCPPPDGTWFPGNASAIPRCCAMSPPRRPRCSWKAIPMFCGNLSLRSSVAAIQRLAVRKTRAILPANSAARA